MGGGASKEDATVTRGQGHTTSKCQAGDSTPRLTPNDALSTTGGSSILRPPHPEFFMFSTMLGKVRNHT